MSSALLSSCQQHQHGCQRGRQGGLLLLQASTVVEQRSDWELCYSRPSVSAPELLNAIAERCASVPDSRPSQALDELKELAEVLKARPRLGMRLNASVAGLHAFDHRLSRHDVHASPCKFASTKLLCSSCSTRTAK